MKKQLLSVLTIFLLSGSAMSQQGDGGSPRSFSLNSTFSKTNMVSFATPNIDQLKAEDAIVDAQKSGPWRFGFNNYVNLNMTNSGTWTELQNGGKLWKLQLTCENALTVNLTLSDVVIPEGNELYVYNPQKDFILGKFTSYHLYEGELGTELVPGNTAIIEYYVAPQNSNKIAQLKINTVTHGYRTASEFQEKAFGSSGNCNMNANCSDGDIWDSQRKSAIMLVSGSNGFCSASMINNTQNDGKPYVLTANHCYSNPTSWIFRFNWQAAVADINQSDCTVDPSSSPSFVSLSGAVLRAKRTPSDFCLVEITGGLVNGTVPLSYNTYFSGWDNTDAIPTTTFCYHHPSGDIKKLSFDDAPAVSGNGMGSSENNSQWEVEWDRNTTTEGGSSGSPLFDQNGRIIGQLWGGGASCWNLSSPDYYGKVSYSWEPAGSNSTNQLKFWLDPNNDGNTVLDGFDPNASPCASTFDSNTIEEDCNGDDDGSIEVVFLTGNSSGATFDIGSGPQASGIFTNLSQGSYTVTVIDGDLCSVDVQVTLDGPTALGLSGTVTPESMPNNGAINVTATGGTPIYDYAWTGPNAFSSSDEDLTGLESGTYDLTVTDNNGCTTSSSFIVNSTVGLSENGIANLAVYPNPSNGIFTVILPQNFDTNSTVEVLDLSGRKVHSTTEIDSTFELNVSHLSYGNYFLKIVSNEKVVTTKISIQH